MSEQQSPSVTVDKKYMREEFTKAFEMAVLAAGDNFIAKWNAKNPSDPVSLRFTPSKGSLPSGNHSRAQMALTFEIKRNFQWNIMSRVTREFPNMATLTKHEDEVAFELWMKMFDEITQIGFASVTSYISPPDGAQTDNKPTTLKGNIQAIPESGV